MEAAELSGARVLVAGLGISGVASVQALHDVGARVSAVDSRPEVAGAAPLPAGVMVFTGQDWPGLAQRALEEKPEVLIASPGLPPHNPLLQTASRGGCRSGARSSWPGGCARRGCRGWR
ncbi:hypothetical protein [Sanguibacter sp. Z1732]|uniref:hypothetical protein n=1 Tax=Sanguibacter sp. Z1732 TaxID=3435412 RepID=UPI003D9C887D